MSTSYDLVCHQHKKKTWLFDTGLSGDSLAPNERGIARFGYKHIGCVLHIIADDADMLDDYEEVD